MIFIKKLFSDKSIEIYTLLLAIVWTSIFSFSLWFSIKDEKQHMHEIITGELNSNYQDIEFFRHWIAGNGGIYVPISDEIKPNPALNHFSEQTLTTQSGKELTLVNTPKLLRLLSEKHPNKFNVHMSSVEPLNILNKADKWEAKALQRFVDGEEEFCEIIEHKGELHMRLMRPARFEPKCAQCHFDKPYQEGDVLGGMTVSIPVKKYYDSTEKIINKLYSSHASIWLFGILGLAFAYALQKKHEAKRKKNEDQLRETNIAFNNLNEGVIITDNNMQILAINQAFENILGFSEDELVNKYFYRLQQHFFSEKQWSDLMRTIEKKQDWHDEVQFIDKSNAIVDLNIRLKAIYNNENILSKYILVFSDISERKDFEKTLAHLAHHDHLTDLPNRLLLNDRLFQAFARSKRNNQSVALLFLDLDNFKYINDSLGHHMGDAILIDATQRLKDNIRKQDTLARHGGDEFIIVIEDVESDEQISSLASKLINSFSKAFVLEQHEFFLGISIGISVFPKDANTEHELLSKADMAMYKAKANGKNNFIFYSPDIDEEFRDKIIVESDLRKALENDELLLHYQPQISISENKIIGVECLVRWQHPEKGLLYPDSFISIAESSGLMMPMGELIIEKACAQMQSWLSEGLKLQKMAINMSPQQLSSSNFGQYVINSIEKYKLPKGCLEFEITENYLTTQDKSSMNNLKILNNADIQIAVDDFGTGYSSLNYLKQLPISKIKIDRSFTDGLPHDSHDRAIIDAVIAIGKSLNFKVIAEGVENVEQLDFLAQANCDEYQGYYCSEPLNAEMLKRFFYEWS